MLSPMCSVYPAKVSGHCKGVEPQVSLCCVRPDSLLEKGCCQRCSSWAQLLCQSLFAHCCSFPSVISAPLPARGPGAARPLRAWAHGRFVLHDSSAKRSHHTQCSGRELCVLQGWRIQLISTIYSLPRWLVFMAVLTVLVLHYPGKVKPEFRSARVKCVKSYLCRGSGMSVHPPLLPAQSPGWAPCQCALRSVSQKFMSFMFWDVSIFHSYCWGQLQKLSSCLSEPQK